MHLSLTIHYTTISKLPKIRQKYKEMVRSSKEALARQMISYLMPVGEDSFCSSSSSSGSVPGPGVGGYATPSQSVLGCPFTRCKAHSRPVPHVVTPLISWSSSSSLAWYHAFDQVSLDAFVPHHMTKIAQFSFLHYPE